MKHLPHAATALFWTAALALLLALPGNALAGASTPKTTEYVVKVINNSGYPLTISKGYFNYSNSQVGGSKTFVTNRTVRAGQSAALTYKIRQDCALDVLQLFLKPVIDGENGSNIIRFTTYQKKNVYCTIDNREINAWKKGGTVDVSY
ncbi:MAG: hypothetical protein H0S85_10935 [Desulfovibrionaceae bacterium]|jgi:hypothetical protein|nr:hypothetical protein [Desulfovibrionaceae bacterium]